MGTEEPFARQGEEDVGDLDPEQDIGVENNGEAGLDAWSVVNPEVLGLAREFV